MELIFEVVDNPVHDDFDLLVVERALLVLQDEVDGIRFLALGQVFAFVNVEKLYFLQQFSLALACHLLDLRKLHALVDEQGEVAAHGGELRDFRVFHLVLADGLHQGCPVEVGVIDFVLDAEILLNRPTDDTELCEHFSTAILQREARREDVVRNFLAHHHTLRNAQSRQDVLHVGVQLIERAVFVGMNPAALHALAREPEAEVHLFGIFFDRKYRIILNS